VKRHQCQRSAPFAREKPWADWKKRLQIRGAGGKSRKRPTLVVGKKPNGKCLFNSAELRNLAAGKEWQPCWINYHATITAFLVAIKYPLGAESLSVFPLTGHLCMV